MRRNLSLGALILFAVLPTTACLFHTRPVEDHYSKTQLKESTQQGLVDYISQQAEKIKSFQATLDIDTSTGGLKKGSVTDYKEIRGYVLARQPAMLHMIGLMPIVRTTAFDMVSNGKEFKLWIPPKNRFMVGRNEVQSYNPNHPMENLRPQNIYEAFLIPPLDPNNELAVLESGYEMLHDTKGHTILQDDYELFIIRLHGEKSASLARKIVFSRVDLKPHRQFIYDDQGKLATDVRYAEYQDFDGVSFPSRIQISRPQEEYEIKMHVLKLDMNKQLPDEKFTLQQPAGAEVIHLDKPQSSSAITPASDNNNR